MVTMPNGGRHRAPPPPQGRRTRELLEMLATRAAAAYIADWIHDLIAQLFG